MCHACLGSERNSTHSRRSRRPVRGMTSSLGRRHRCLSLTQTTPRRLHLRSRMSCRRLQQTRRKRKRRSESNKRKRQGRRRLGLPRRKLGMPRNRRRRRRRQRQSARSRTSKRCGASSNGHARNNMYANLSHAWLQDMLALHCSLFGSFRNLSWPLCSLPAAGPIINVGRTCCQAVGRATCSSGCGRG